MSYCGCDQVSYRVQADDTKLGGFSVQIILREGCPYAPEIDWGSGFEAITQDSGDPTVFYTGYTVLPNGNHTVNVRMPHMDYWVKAFDPGMGGGELIHQAKQLAHVEDIKFEVQDYLLPWDPPFDPGDTRLIAGLPLTSVWLRNAGMTGKLSDLVASPLAYMIIQNTDQITGSLEDLWAIKTMEYPQILNLTNVDISSGWGQMPALRMFNLDTSTPKTDAEITAFLRNSYLHRFDTKAASVGYMMSFGAPVPGTYQNAATPTTANEYLYKLVNDPDNEGFSHWYNAA